MIAKAKFRFVGMIILYDVDENKKALLPWQTKELPLMAEKEGFDLRCGAGHLGLQHAPGMLPSALGFESPFGM